MRPAVHPKRRPLRQQRRRRAGAAMAFALAGLTAGAAASGGAAAAEAPVPGTASWSLVHEAGEGHCLAHAFFPRSRIALGFVSDGEHVGVALVHSAWRLREWQEYDVAFRFDGGPAVSARLTATDATAMATELDADGGGGVPQGRGGGDRGAWRAHGRKAQPRRLVARHRLRAHLRSDRRARSGGAQRQYPRLTSPQLRAPPALHRSSSAGAAEFEPGRRVGRRLSASAELDTRGAPVATRNGPRQPQAAPPEGARGTPRAT